MSLNCNFTMKLAATLLLAVSSVAEPIRVIDLTTPVPPSSQSTRFPGGWGGAVPGKVLGPATFELPLTITVESASVKDGHIDLLVTLRNTGSKGYAVPVQRDFARVHKDGNKNRRTLLFLLILHPDLPSGIMATASSSAVADSSVLLKPQEAISLKLRSPFSPGDGVLRDGQQIQMSCKESKLDDDSFVVDSQSNFVVSTPVTVVNRD